MLEKRLTVDETRNQTVAVGRGWGWFGRALMWKQTNGFFGVGVWQSNGNIKRARFFTNADAARRYFDNINARRAARIGANQSRGTNGQFAPKH
jgi:hypothetical protein